MKLLMLMTFTSLLMPGCKHAPDNSALFQLVENTGIDFTNRVQNSPDFNIFSYRNFYNGAGVAIGDINNDGLPDIFFTANMGPNKLYLNKGDFQFEDISEKAGFGDKKKWSTGVVMADVNNDGWLDIYVCNAGFQQGVSVNDELFINNKNLQFSDSASAYGLIDNDYTTHASFFDYDLDGDLDLYLLNNSFIPVNTLNYANNRTMPARDWPVADFLKGGGDKLMRNDNGKFVDVTEEAGIYGSLIGFGLGISVGDVNDDGYPDIYIANDFYERDYLYINQQNGTFKEDLENRMQHISLSSMGADMGDINNDGFQDIFTTDMLPDDEYRLKTTSSFENIDVYRMATGKGFYHQFMQNTLQVNDANGKFLEVAHYSGVEASDWSWGALIFDADNDGFNDIYVCNGIYHDVTDQDFIDFFANEIVQQMALTGQKEQVDEIITKMPSRPLVNKLFRNIGNLKFTDAGALSGITQPSFSNGAAYGDLDNDGDYDLVVSNVNGPAFIYRNNSTQSGRHFVAVSLKGNGKNTFAVGSTIKIYKGDEILRRDIFPSRGFQSSVDYKVIIGVPNEKIDSMTISWPDRSISTYYSPAIDTLYTIQQPEGKKIMPETKPSISEVLMDTLPHEFIKHVEDEYVDFYYERNIPMMVSREGPKAAIGDVNGDMLMDIYIGGAAGQEGQLYIQSADGKFVRKRERIFTGFADFEDGPVLFFDCDKDGDLDLFVGSAGNNHAASSREMQNRLYINDGKGDFQIRADALPPNEGNTSVVIAHDWDRDGDIDLFVGSRSIPGNYGMTPTNYLLVNDGTGKFSDMARKNNPDIAQIGLVTAAVWSNIHGDTEPELIITGEWMAPRIFSYKSGKFIEIKSNLSDLKGLWQAINAADVDGDGDMDLLLGNIGENFTLQPDTKNPVKLWVKDFDGNNTVDKIITRTVDGKDKTVFLKRDVTDQLPSLKKENLRHENFARKSIKELFKPADLKDCLIRTFNYSSSCIAFNDGDGNFTVKKMPQNLQLSTVNAIHVTDVNGDGLPDIIAGGNNFGFIPQFGRQDASAGHILLNKGNGVFTWVHGMLSGLDLKGEIRDIKEIETQFGKRFLVLQNDKHPVLYHLRNRKQTLRKQN